MKQHRAYDRDIVGLLIFTLVTLSTWVVFEVYRAYTKPNIPELLARHLRELNPTLNTGILSALNLRLP
jgi:hypothetical protein